MKTASLLLALLLGSVQVAQGQVAQAATPPPPAANPRVSAPAASAAAPPVGAVPSQPNTFPFRSLPEVFSTDEKTILSACAGGFVIGSGPHTTEAQLAAFDEQAKAFLRGRALFDTRTKSGGVKTPAGLADPFVIIESPAGTALKLCIPGKMMPTALPPGFQDKLLTWVYLGGELESLKGVKDWTVQVALLNASGKELARFKPTQTYKGIEVPDAEGPEWEKVCSEDKCRWSGMNGYVFNLGTFPKETQTLRLIYTRGQGTEMRDYNAQTFDDSQLADLP